MSIQLTSLVVLVAIASDIVLSAPTIPTSDVTESESNLLSQYVSNKYPLTDPILFPDGSFEFRMAIISDLDSDSVSSNEKFTWKSYFKRGNLTYNPANKNISIIWDAPTNGQVYKSHFSMGGRGMELSELVTYNGQLITLDDKSGLVYIIEGNVLIPWVIVVEGNGHQKRGIKGEWATVKDSKLYVGSHGKELVTKDGMTSISTNNMWVKTIDVDGGVHHLNWTENYVKLRAAFGIHFPGYMTHESCMWSDVHNRWFFLPRKASVDPYNFDTDERKATNVLLIATSDFEDIKVTRIGEIVPNHGYASFKFIPGTNDTIITAIKTQEEGDSTATFITAFTIDGEILYPETKVSDLKFEGFEFI